MREDWSPLPAHVESSIQAIASLHADHETSASRLERAADVIKSGLGRPVASFVLLSFVFVWIGINLGASLLHVPAFDHPPFAWLDLLLAVFTTLMTVIILASQRRSELLVNRHQQLMLQLAFLGDHKVAKVIALLEELRRDDPTIKDRTDHQAAAMTQTTDPTQVLDAIEETRAGLVSTATPVGGKPVR